MVPYTLPLIRVRGVCQGWIYVSTIAAREYVNSLGHSPFGRWFDRLDSRAAAKIRVAVLRLQAGNTSNVKSVGQGVLEKRVHFGPGYRIHFGMDGDSLIVLLGGGSKGSQQRDIDDARRFWQDYRHQRSMEV